MEEYNQIDENIPLLDFFRELRQKFWQILFMGIVGVLVSSLFTFFILKPTYSSTVDLVVNEPSAQENQPINQSVIQTNLSLLNTYEGIIKKPNVLEQVIDETQADLTVEELAQLTTVATEEDSLLLSISVESESPYSSADLANTIAEKFINEVQNILQVNNVFIWNSAEPVLAAVSPNIPFNLLLGLVIGVAIGISYYIGKYIMDPTVKSEKFAEELGLTLLGIVPKMSEETYEDTVLRKSYKMTPQNRKRRV